MKELDRYRLWLFLTVGMGIATFCVANASPGLTLISLPLWLLAWPASYGKNGKPLPRPLILALVLAATANLIAGVLRTPDDIVAVVAEYLVWLHLVKLYDRSEPRDQGQLLTMSLFLALGACLTSNSFALALMLLVYVPMFVWTLMLHQLHSGRRQAEAGLEELRPADRRRIRPDAAIGLRPQSRFAALVAGVLVFSFIGAAIVFVITPRQSMTTFVADWSSPSVGRVSGFNDEVRLGAAGLLSESNTPVFDLRVTNEEGEDIGQQLGQLRLRGAVLDQYSDGQWRKSAEGARLGTRTAAPGQASIVSGEVEGYPRITQMVTFRGRSGGPLFALYRPLEFETDRAREFRTNFRDASIEIEDSGRSTYRIVSQPDAPLRQAIDADENDPRFLEGPIRELTDQVLADAGLARDETAAATESDRAIAERIESWLQLNFEYTVEMVAPSPGEDPIEMFLFRTRRGHCEYFASAMAAMCRSVGLDARVVTGYVASEYDPVSGEFTVRESDAHAWVEAEIDEGHWATFDPSPPSDLAVVHERPDSILWRLRKLWDRMERVWVKSVVAFDEEKREAIVGETVIDATKRVQSRGLEMMRMSARERRSQFFSALAIGLAAFAGVAGAGFLARGGLSALQTWIERRRELQEAEEIDPTLAARLRQAGFYDEFLAESRRAGLARAKWEAPMAHAERLREIDRPLGDSARQLVRLYFDLRWGRRLLSEAEVERARRLVEAARERLAARRSGGAADDEAQTPSVG